MPCSDLEMQSTLFLFGFCRLLEALLPYEDTYHMRTKQDREREGVECVFSFGVEFSLKTDSGYPKDKGVT